MVTPREYEKYQLELIKIDYEGRGYTFRSETNPVGADVGFDAVAERSNPHHIVVIELVNGTRSNDENLVARARRITDFFRGKANVSVDLRYIDKRDETARRVLERVRVSHESLAEHGRLRAILDRRLPQLAKELQGETAGAKSMVTEWTALAQTVRIFCETIMQANGDPILDLYNTLLQRFEFLPAETKSKSAMLDLFELYDLTTVALEGGAVELQYIHQLRAHHTSLRRQMKKYLVQNDG